MGERSVHATTPVNIENRLNFTIILTTGFHTSRFNMGSSQFCFYFGQLRSVTANDDKFSRSMGFHFFCERNNRLMFNCSVFTHFTLDDRRESFTQNQCEFVRLRSLCEMDVKFGIGCDCHIQRRAKNQKIVATIAIILNITQRCSPTLRCDYDLRPEVNNYYYITNSVSSEQKTHILALALRSLTGKFSGIVSVTRYCPCHRIQSVARSHTI